MSREDSDFRLSEYDDMAARYGYADFDTFIGRDFPRYNEATRAAVLQRWDELMENETAPTRETAAQISRRRRLDDVHWALVKAGR